MIPSYEYRRHAGSIFLVCIAALVFVLTWPQRVTAADLVFVGSLEKITSESISILLPEGILIDAHLSTTPSLSAEKLAAGRNVGDEVEMIAATINPVYDQHSETYRYLELKSLRQTRAEPKPVSL